MAFTDSFVKPRTGFNEVLSGLEDVSARLAESFAKDPAIRAQKQIARIRKQEREESSQNQRIESGVKRLRALGTIVQQFAENGQPVPDGLVKVVRRAGAVLAEDDPNIAEQWTEGILSLTKLRAEEEVTEAVSPIGKLQADREEAVNRFGEGSPQVRQIDAVIGQSTTEPVQPLNLIFPDGKKVGFDRVTQKQEIISAFERGAIPVGLSVQAGDVAGLGLPGKREREEAGAEARALAGGIAQASATLSDLENTIRGSGSGLKGLAIEKVGGFLGQFSQAAEEGFAKTFGDATPAEVKRFRFRSRSIVAGMLSSITGEQSGRFTEQERAIANEALGALEATSSPEQVAAGISTALEIMLLSQDRNAIAAGVQPREDLNTDDGIEAMGQRLLNLGMKRNQAEEVLIRLIRQRKELQRTLPGR